LTVQTVISDFGGVLTSPLIQSFVAFQDETSITMENLGSAMQRIAERDGTHPLFDLEKGLITEVAFLDRVADELEPEIGHRPDMHSFTEIYFNALEPNAPMIELMRELQGRGLRMALLTNNVREWEPRWRTMVPIDEIFELVVDSAFVGCRKPEPRIYEILLERLGVEAAGCLFVDDVEVNCEAARELGMAAVHFRDNEQAIAEVRASVDGSP
jgi:epoxide hydrolase-like predicted phosphatase